MYSVTALSSGFTLELMNEDKNPRILIRDSAGVVWEAIQFEWFEKHRAHNTYDLLIALAGGPVAESLTAA